MKLGIAWSEPSTRRGLVLLVGGGAALYNAFAGGHLDVDSLMRSVDGWLGLAITMAGLLGFFVKDEPSTTHIVLPPIELQAQSDSASLPESNPTDASRDFLRDSSGVCDAMPAISGSRSSSSPSDGSQAAGWNG
mgnify:CR=1 FL=1